MKFIETFRIGRKQIGFRARANLNERKLPSKFDTEPDYQVKFEQNLNEFMERVGNKGIGKVVAYAGFFSRPRKVYDLMKKLSK